MYVCSSKESTNAKKVLKLQITAATIIKKEKLTIGTVFLVH